MFCKAVIAAIRGKYRKEPNLLVSVWVYRTDVNRLIQSYHVTSHLLFILQDILLVCTWQNRENIFQQKVKESYRKNH